MNVFMIVQRVLMPARLGGVGVAAVGEDVAAEPASRGQERHEDRDADDDDERERDARLDLEAARRLGDRRARPRTASPVLPANDSCWRRRRRRATTATADDADRAPRPTSAGPGIRTCVAGVGVHRGDRPTARTGTMPKTQLSVPPSEPSGPPPMRMKVGSSGATVVPPLNCQMSAAEAEQAAEGHDERRDLDVGDEEALEARR